MPKVFRSFRSFVPMVGGGVSGDGRGKDEERRVAGGRGAGRLGKGRISVNFFNQVRVRGDVW